MVRNSGELGLNLFKLANYLLKDKNLLKLLTVSSEDPLAAADVANPTSLMHKNVRIVPLLKEDELVAQSVVILSFPECQVDEKNKEISKVAFEVLLYCPLSTWLVNDESLRPFLIISELEQSLKDKPINGLGTISYDGWRQVKVTGTATYHTLYFTINAFT